MLPVYRLISLPTLNAPGPLWEWRQPWTDYMLRNTCTFGRQVVQRSFVSWEALDGENTRLWETTFASPA